MTYPDGTRIQVGDLVWFDEGARVGFVQWIWEEARDGDFSWAQTEGPPLFIANRHPYSPSSEGFGSGELHDEPCLADEGVGLLDAAELEELRMATALARDRSRAGLGGSFYSVLTRAENHQRVEWIFRAHAGDACIEEIVIRCDDLHRDMESK